MRLATDAILGSANPRNQSSQGGSGGTKTSKFRHLLHSGDLEFLMEAHNGLSAKIVEETGFQGIWASGLSISAALGVRDCNEASWTQVLDVVEFMSDATSIPILLDGDTGYGNFNNVRRLVRKLEQRGVAAVCLEDKVFPKTNSFLGDENQLLAAKEEFAGKIKAAKDSQNDPNFSVVARMEGFIANRPVDEVLDRADACYEAGADALLIHTKRSTAVEIATFVDRWDRPCPLVIVPTTYGQTPTSDFRALGISLVIWANHNLRSAIQSMQGICRKIYASESIADLDNEIVPVSEVFRLQDTRELEDAEKRYLPGSNGLSRTNGSKTINGSGRPSRSNGSDVGVHANDANRINGSNGKKHPHPVRIEA